MPRLRKPRALPSGGTLGIAAPCGPVSREAFEAGVARWRDAGYRVVHREDLFARHGYLAGDDARRTKELLELWSDPGVDAILCARGGYGCDRILASLDADLARRAAKPLVGYSDVTALLLWQRRRAGLIGFHGPMLERGDDLDGAAFDALLRQLRGEETLPVELPGAAGGGGAATGRLVGGSLTLAAASLGTAWEIDTRGALLLLEDRGESPYRIDRMLQQLRGAGKLAAAAGFGIGDFTSCVDARYPERDVDTVISEVLRPFGAPIVTGLPFGHRRENFPWPVGARATLDGDRGVLRISERGVERSS